MKILFPFLICILFSSMLSAQYLFKPIPKQPKTEKRVNDITGVVTNVTVAEPTFWMFRPSIVAATLFIGGTVEAAAGTGIAYQNITQKGTDSRNYVNYDIGVYVMAGGSIVNREENKSDIEKFALIATALNGTVGMGYALSRQEDVSTLKRKWKGGLALVWKINLNN